MDPRSLLIRRMIRNIERGDKNISVCCTPEGMNEIVRTLVREGLGPYMFFDRKKYTVSIPSTGTVITFLFDNPKLEGKEFTEVYIDELYDTEENRHLLNTILCREK